MHFPLSCPFPTSFPTAFSSFPRGWILNVHCVPADAGPGEAWLALLTAVPRPWRSSRLRTPTTLTCSCIQFHGNTSACFSASSVALSDATIAYILATLCLTNSIRVGSFSATCDTTNEARNSVQKSRAIDSQNACDWLRKQGAIGRSSPLSTNSRAVDCQSHAIAVNRM